MSRVTCHVSCVMCHMSHVTIFSSSFFGQRGEAYRWRVCYQRGLPRLVFYSFDIEEHYYKVFSRRKIAKTTNCHFNVISKLHNFALSRNWLNIMSLNQASELHHIVTYNDYFISMLELDRILKISVNFGYTLDLYGQTVLCNMKVRYCWNYSAEQLKITFFGEYTFV